MPQQIVMGSSWNSAQIPKDPVDKNFQYTIAPSASLHEHGRGKDQKPNNTLGSNDYVKRNVKIENAVVQTSTKRKYNRKKQSPAKLLPKMTNRLQEVAIDLVGSLKNPIFRFKVINSHALVVVEAVQSMILQ